MFSAEEMEASRGLLGHLASRWVHTDSVDDFVQEAMLKAWKCRDQYRGDAKLSTWLTRIMMNVILGSRRKLADRIQPIIFVSLDPTYDSIPELTPSAETVLIRAQRQERLNETIETLDPRYREALMDFYVHDRRTLDSQSPIQKILRFRAIRMVRKKLKVNTA